MSLKVTSLVWEEAPTEDVRELMVLLALSDWANDEGVSWYAVSKIARKARCSERTCQYTLRRLSGPEMLAKIAEARQRDAETVIFRCADIGHSDCRWETSARTDEELMTAIEKHGRGAHGLEAMDDGMRRRFQEAIRERRAEQKRQAREFAQLINGQSLIDITQRGSRKLTNIYRVNVPLLRRLRSLSESKERDGASAAPLPIGNGAIQRSGGCNSRCAPVVQSSAGDGARAIAPESLERLSVEPSRGDERGSSAALPPIAKWDDYLDFDGLPLTPEEFSLSRLMEGRAPLPSELAISKALYAAWKAGDAEWWKAPDAEANQ